jgi:glycerol-3-phosphate acyltransferase PlsY
VDGTLCTCTPRGDHRTTSVNVPPVSMPMRAATGRHGRRRPREVEGWRAAGPPPTFAAMTLWLGCLCAFLLGGVPSALVLVRLCKGIDVRTIGSGNVGATNAMRAFATRRGGLGAFGAIWLLDAGKGFVPALLGQHLLPDRPLLGGTLLGASAILGHVFTPFLHFRGGKGVATTTGVLLALDWLAALLAIGVFFVVRALTGKVFLGSLALGVALALAAVLLHLGDAFGPRLPVTILCLALAGFLFWTHRSNLQQHFGAAKGALR